MFDYLKVLEENPNGVIATQDREKVRTRVFQFLFGKANKIYFCTSSEKPVYSQIVKNPNISFCTYSQDFSPVISISGKAIFVDDMELKFRALDENPDIKSIYGSAENPIFKVFYIEVKDLEIFSMQEGLRQYKL